ncbi:DUF1639 family protein [Zea mays]|uniref:DUF1639 family protein n=1 Tax=Zea mays TaxID=4577 RepID=A0A1D6FJT3_MAIZE|nr:DUF1639 family protein [Zea mays]
MAMKGTKLPQRPKRRPKIIEKTVSQQKHRGLKGMESIDSDSD